MTDIENLQQLIHEHLSPELEKTAMNIAKQLELKGRREGMEQGKALLAVQLVRQGLLSTEKVLELTGLSQDVLDALLCAQNTL